MTPYSPSQKILEHHVLEASGERQLESVRQLILRGRQLSSFDSACASRLQNLVVRTLHHRYPRNIFHCLVEVESSTDVYLKIQLLVDEL